MAQSMTIYDYYSNQDPNAHVVHFYVTLGRPLNVIARPEMDDTLNRTLGTGNWSRVGPGWEGLLLLVKYDIQCNSEREREELLVREMQPLITELKKIPIQHPQHLVKLSRACFYTLCPDSVSSQPISHPSMSLTPDGIDTTIGNTYRHGDAHIDYFYLHVQAKIADQCFILILHEGKAIDIPDMAIRKLEDLPGEWRRAEPQDIWPETLVGFYPKGFSQLNEREREEKLNMEVRQPLIESLEEQLIKEHFFLFPKVNVIISRVV